MTKLNSVEDYYPQIEQIDSDIEDQFRRRLEIIRMQIEFDHSPKRLH